MPAAEERQRILDLLDNGTITAEQAIQLLAATDEGVESLAAVVPTAEPATLEANPDVAVGNTLVEPLAVAQVDVHTEPPAEDQPPVPEDFPSQEAEPAESPFDPGKLGWRKWWEWPLWIGVSVTVVSAGLMYQAYQDGGLGFWFACTWFPFSLGVLTLAFAWASRTARWIHIRVQHKPGERPERIAISLPIPLRLTAWFFSTFRPNMPGMKANPADLLLSLENVSPEARFYVRFLSKEDAPEKLIDAIRNVVRINSGLPSQVVNFFKTANVREIHT